MNDEVVDMGLSTRYATCNLGANSPEEPGEYFAWGELMPKSKYNAENYLFFHNGNHKYGREGDCSRLDPAIKKVLDLEDDVAHVRLGGSWRLPCLKDIAELHEKCAWKWTTMNGVKGYLITSKVEGYADRSLFLPASGRFLRDETVNVGRAGYY